MLYTLTTPIIKIISCFKTPQGSVRQGKNQRESAVYMGVNEHFEPIFNAGLRRIIRGFNTASKMDADLSDLEIVHGNIGCAHIPPCRFPSLVPLLVGLLLVCCPLNRN